MRVAVFLVCMCFLMLSGGRYASVPTPGDSIQHNSAQKTEKKQQIKFTGTRQQFEIKNSILNDETAYFINEEDDDEDVNKTPNRKSKTLNNCYLAFSGVFNVIYHNNSSSAYRPLYSLPSNKYISQRALRI